MSETKRTPRGDSRRSFLKLAATAAPAAAVAAVSTTPAAARLAEEAGDGLRATEHTAKYFETARF